MKVRNFIIIIGTLMIIVIVINIFVYISVTINPLQPLKSLISVTKSVFFFFKGVLWRSWKTCTTMLSEMEKRPVFFVVPNSHLKLFQRDVMSVIRYKLKKNRYNILAQL